MKNTLLLIKIIFLLIFSPLCSFAQKGNIKVVIVDISPVKVPIPSAWNGAELKLISVSDSTKVWEGKMLKDGSFLLKNIPIGTYNLSFFNAYAGKKIQKGIEIKAKETTQVEFTINNQSAFGCHKCRSKDIIPIIYGYSISEEEKKLGNEGKLIWKGDIVGHRWFCKNCKSDI